MADIRAIQIKSALLYKKQEVVELLSNKVPPSDLRLKLWQAGVLTDDELSRLGDTSDRQGPVGQARQLLDIVLANEVKLLQPFLKELGTLCIEAYSIIEDNADVLNRISTHIAATYKARKCHLVQVLPGEKLQLDLHRAEYVMEIVILAEKLVHREKQTHWLSESELKHDYEQVDIASVKGVLRAMYEGHESTVLCLGIAGVGKTICAKKFLTQWVDGDGVMAFKIVIIIPMRDVTISSPIVDIIGEGVGNLGLVNDTMHHTLEFFLQEEFIAPNVLIIIDGIDERDIPASSELYQFITGQKYPHVKKMITARPEAALLSQLSDFYPDYKVTVQGTSRKGVYGYLKAVMTDDDTPPTDDSVHNLIEKCENEMIEFDLLQIPLYLTFVGFIFNFHWAQYCTFANFIIPNTTTKLFTSFITIIIRIWLKKIGRTQEFKEEMAMFQNNPIGSKSKIPRDIKRVLVFFGKLSYNFIEKQQYNFTENDLEEYLIDVEDIKQSGMFCMAEKQGQLQCFYRHKTMQEYMAALYLSHVQFESESFSKYLLPERVSNKKVLLHIFSKLSIVLKFVFGIDTQFACKIISKLKGNLSVSKDFISKDIDLQYEASLYDEIEDPKLSKAMLNLLTDTRPVKMEDSSFFQCSPSVVHALCQAFSSTQTHTLLRNWFGLIVNQRGQEWCISHTNCLEIDSLSHALYVLALKHQYHNVLTLSVTKTDVGLDEFLRLFPKLKHLNINGNIMDKHNCTYCDSSACSNRHDTTNNKSLTHVNAICDTLPIPLPFCQSLLQQTGLESLRLHGKLHSLCEAVAIGPVSLGNLTNLDFYVRDMVEQEAIDIVETSMLILKTHTPVLKAFALGRYITFSEPVNQICIAKVMDALRSLPLPAINTLRFFEVLDSEAVLALCDHLPLGVRTLSLSGRDLSGIAKTFMQKLSHCCPGVTDMQVIYENKLHKKQAISILRKLMSHRLSKPTHPQIKLGIYDYTYRKYQSESALSATDVGDSEDAYDPHLPHTNTGASNYTALPRKIWVFYRNNFLEF